MKKMASGRTMLEWIPSGLKSPQFRFPMKLTEYFSKWICHHMALARVDTFNLSQIPLDISLRCCSYCVNPLPAPAFVSTKEIIRGGVRGKGKLK
jgi:hypothetical protein